MNHIGKIVIRMFFPVISAWLLRSYEGIWGLKSAIGNEEGPFKRALLLYVYERNLARHGSWIGYTSQFQGPPCFPHGISGIFISGAAELGKNVVIFQQVTIGSNTLVDSLSAGAPRIGNNVYIGAGAKIIGNITIGDNCRIGANTVVYEDVPPNSIAVQQPTRIIQKQALDNRFYTQRNGQWVYFDDGRWIVDKKKKVD